MTALVVALVVCACTSPVRTGQSSLERWLTEATLADVAAALASGEVSSEAIVAAYLVRIERLDRAGPRLRSVLVVNPNALEDARDLDAARSQGDIRGPLHGVPILIKDNIETKDAIPTTAGALALRLNLAAQDAPVVAGLREAGAVILGKTNLSQWANFRSENSVSGWSSLGGQVRNPHVLDRSPCGSSSGSGAAMAASLAAGTVGTETNGSVICPAAMNGIVGFKPTVGLIAQTGIIPISTTQDTAGPMTRTVRDAALMLSSMATSNKAEDFGTLLSNDALSGRRIGVLRFATGDDPRVADIFDKALTVLSNAGARLVDITEYDRPDDVFDAEYKVLLAEFKWSLNAYLRSTPTEVTTRTLTDLIAFNTTVADVELALFDQDIFEKSDAEPDLSDPAYIEARDRVLLAVREKGIDHLLREHKVELLVAPTLPPAFLIDPVHGDAYDGSVGVGWMAAIAGYPHLTVPMGAIHALPVGLSFIGTADDDARVLTAGHAYETRSQMRIAPGYLPTVEAFAKSVSDR